MFKRNLAVIALTTLLGACGFQLRGTENSNFAVRELNVQARDAYGPLIDQVEQVLEQSGVEVSRNAPFTLLLGQEEMKQRAVSYTGSSRAAEWELTSKVDYQILGRRGILLMEDSLDVERVFFRDSNNVVGSDQESSQLRSEMRRDLVQLVVQRLRHLTPEQLNALQETAEARAKAEAEALRLQREAKPEASPLQNWPQ